MAKSGTKAATRKAAPAKGGKVAAKPKLVARRDQPRAVRGRKEPANAKEILRHAKAPTPDVRRDEPEPVIRRAAEILKELRKEHFEFHEAEGRENAFDASAFAEFFAAEIETEVSRPAIIVNDRFARWRCQCCDAVIPVPRRTTVFHGDYVLEHDDTLGLIVNGERWVPRAETPLEVVQPGRLRNPWTGRTIEGKDLGTTGVY